jgi:hypothetical protein
LDALEKQWRDYVGLIGKTVEVESNAGSWRGRLHALGFTGLELAQNGEITRLTPEQVRRISLATLIL